MAVRTLWNFVVGRVKIFVNNYNAVERSQKVFETGKRPPPRHPGTEAKYKVLIRENPDLEKDIQTEIEKKPIELLDRLKVVKVSSEGTNPKEEKSNRPLPQMRSVQPSPEYGFEEPKVVAEGRCTLRQALEFITNHQNDPEKHSIASIAATYKMKSSDVENVIENFRAFQLYISRDNEKFRVTEEVAKALGATKIIESVSKSIRKSDKMIADHPSRKDKTED